MNFLICSNNFYFGILTFNKSVLNSTSVKTRRYLVSNFLKENCSKYLCRRYSSGFNDRDFYRICFISDNLDFFDNWKYGSFKLEKYQPE